jgi:uncharacterized protein YcbK (DUF882 family)
MKYFKYSEFDSPDLLGSGKTYMNKEFLKMLDLCRERCGFPFRVTSGYRTQAWQDELTRRGYKTAKNRSAHQDGLAADIKITNNLQRALIVGNTMEICTDMDLPVRIGIAGEGKGNFVHIDVKESKHPRLWVY